MGPTETCRVGLGRALSPDKRPPCVFAPTWLSGGLGWKQEKEGSPQRADLDPGHRGPQVRGQEAEGGLGPDSSWG